MKRKILLFSVTAMLVIGLLAVGCAPAPAPTPTPTPTPAPSPSAPKVLKAVGEIPLDNMAMIGTHWVADAVEEYSGGKLIIDLLGNGEVIPTEDQIFAVGQGSIDIIFSMGDDVSQAEPLGFGMALTGMAPWEEREAGIWDFYREVFANSANAYWLGHYCAPQWWRLWSNVRVESPADLEGIKVRAGMTHFGALKEMGAVPVSTPMSDIYTSMERGVVDAFVFPPIGWTQWGWAEVTKYAVGPRILFGQNSCPLINLDVWNSLSKEEQGWLTQPFLDYEHKWYDANYELWSGSEYGEDAALAAGVELITWSDADNEQFSKTWLEGTWEYATDAMDPEVAARFAELVGK